MDLNLENLVLLSVNLSDFPMQQFSCFLILPTDSLEANVFARNSAKLEVYHRQPKQQLSEIIRVCVGIFTTALRKKFKSN